MALAVREVTEKINYFLRPKLELDVKEVEGLRKKFGTHAVSLLAEQNVWLLKFLPLRGKAEDVSRMRLQMLKAAEAGDARKTAAHAEAIVGVLGKLNAANRAVPEIAKAYRNLIPSHQAIADHPESLIGAIKELKGMVEEKRLKEPRRKDFHEVFAKWT